jgi:hypothetical protein
VLSGRPGVDASPAARHSRLLGGSGSRCVRRGKAGHGSRRTQGPAPRHEQDAAFPARALARTVADHAPPPDEQQAPSSGVPLPHKSGSPHAYSRRGVYLRVGRQAALRPCRPRPARAERSLAWEAQLQPVGWPSCAPRRMQRRGTVTRRGHFHSETASRRRATSGE